MDGPSHVPAQCSKVAEFNAPNVFDQLPEPNSQTYASVVAAGILTTYATAAKDNRNLNEGHMLHHVHSTTHVQKRCVLKQEHILDVQKVLGFCLVGYFAGWFPGNEAIHKGPFW